MKPEVLAMCRNYYDVEVGILEVYTAQPLLWLHDYNYGLESLHPERSLANSEVEELKVQDGFLSSVSFVYQEVCAVKPASLMV